MGKPDFYGPRLKLKRAEQHINELDAVFREYVAENVKRMRSENEKPALEGAMIGGGLPEHTPAIIGDALHNLRASLDHAYCVLIEANNSTVTNWSRFPFDRKGWQAIEGSIKGQEDAGTAPSAKVIAYIRDEVQPFPSGKLDLLALHELDIADKHRLILPNLVGFTADIEFPGGGGMTGITLMSTGADKSTFRSFVSSRGAKYSFDEKSVFQINFGKGQPLEGKPIIQTLRGFQTTIAKILDDLEGLA